MEESLFDLKIIVLILAAAFIFASIMGYIAHSMKMSPILGYLIAGYIIGPYSPGLVADTKIAEQLAEIGVILMMFGVGLHFKWQDLLQTKHIAIPGAIGQTCVATIAGTILFCALGWPIEMGIVCGFALAVASTVVMVRVLTDEELLDTTQGHIAMGWLIVEDVITVVMLLLLPILSNSLSGEIMTLQSLGSALVVMSLKIAALVIVMFTIGRQFVSYAVSKVSRTKSHELFTLTILALTFAIATGASLIFGVSMAMGAFIAGMVLGQTQQHKRVENNAMPMRDAFVVIFFISVGMIFNPVAMIDNPLMFLGTLAIILILKPLTAFIITIVLKQPVKTAIMIALALAQIGEFSFILAETGLKLKIVHDDIYDIIVASAIVTIGVNPLLFRLVKRVKPEWL